MPRVASPACRRRRRSSGRRARSGSRRRRSRATASGSTRPAASASRTTPPCGSGRSTSSRTSGPRSGSSSRSRRAHRTSASSPPARCPGPEWFPGARLSYAEHVFRGRRDDDVAIRHASELRPLGEWTWAELRAHAGAVAGALREAGVEAGDRVAAYLPNIPETVAAFLGCASIGAVWSSCAPEFGVRSVVDRFAQIEPKVLLAVDGYRYGGRDFDRSETIAALQQELPTLRQTFVLPYLAGGDWELPRRRARVRPAAVRPSALGALQLGHHRPAEGDRPWPGWDPARAPEEAPPPPRRARRRPAVLVHDHRLDDVELPRRRPALGGVDRPLRRQSGVPRPRDAVGSRRRRGHHVVRHERRLPRRLPEGGRPPARGP